MARIMRHDVVISLKPKVNIFTFMWKLETKNQNVSYINFMCGSKTLNRHSQQ